MTRLSSILRQALRPCRAKEPQPLKRRVHQTEFPAGPGILFFFWLLVGCWLGQTGLATDWPQYRGANHDGTSSDRITTNWDSAVTNAVWRAPAVNGFSSFAVSGGLAVTQVRRTVDGLQKEVCVAFNIANGLELWSTVIDNALYDAGSGTDDGPRTTPSVDAQGIYVLSSYLKLFRLRPSDGTVVWQTNLLAGYGGTIISWQNGASPLLDSGLIFLNANCGSRTIMALRTADGGLVWRSQESDAMTHATPVLATILGVRQLIFATQAALVALDPSSGKRLWYFPYPFQYAISLAISPVVYGDLVFISGANGMGSCAARVSFANETWSARQVWSSPLATIWMTPVCLNGSLYGQFGSTTAAALKCINLETGEERWSAAGFGRGGTVLVNNRLLALTEAGVLILIEPTPDAYVEIGRFQAVTGKCWNSPAVSDGRIYARSTSQAACYDLSIPDLKLESPHFLDSTRIELTVTTANGTPLSTNRLAGIGILTSTNLDLPPEQWTKLTNGLRLSNGALRVGPVDTQAAGRQFFRVVEK